VKKLKKAIPAQNRVTKPKDVIPAKALIR